MTDLLLALGIWALAWAVVCGLVAAAVAGLQRLVRWLLAEPVRGSAAGELDDSTVPDLDVMTGARLAAAASLRGWGPW